jgi:hypothetical protein
MCCVFYTYMSIKNDISNKLHKEEEKICYDTYLCKIILKIYKLTSTPDKYVHHR